MYKRLLQNFHTFNSSQRFLLKIFSYPPLWKFCKFAKQEYDIVSNPFSNKGFSNNKIGFLHLFAADEICVASFVSQNFQGFFEFSLTARENDVNFSVAKCLGVENELILVPLKYISKHFGEFRQLPTPSRHIKFFNINLLRA